MTNVGDIYRKRATYSKKRLEKLRKCLAKLSELKAFPGLTIFGAGSFARLEASKYSDIDLFFLINGSKENVSEPNTNSLRLFGKVIEIVDKLDFPKFSNDCEYLVLLPTDEICAKLGSRKDDHENYFTARMLLLLESQCLYGKAVFDNITASIISSYFKDYPDHKHTFQPIFLLNDICRYWKTLLLNYENKRNLPPGAEDVQRKTRQKVRNFKLKYSRMTTCFASIAALGSYTAPVTEKQVVELTRLTPRQRLEWIPSLVPTAKAAVDEVLTGYAGFLELTALPTSEIEGHFSDKQKRTEMFQQANRYGDSMFKLLQVIDEANPKLKLMRNLVI